MNAYWPGSPLRVDTEHCRTAEEELEHIEEQFSKVGNFFACDVHPSAVRASNATLQRLWRKRHNLTTSPEYRYSRWSNCPGDSIADLPDGFLDEIDPYKISS